MQLLLILATLCTLVVANQTGWKQIKSPMEHPRYKEVLSKIYSMQNFNEVLRNGRIVGGSLASSGQVKTIQILKQFLISLFLSVSLSNLHIPRQFMAVRILTVDHSRNFIKFSLTWKVWGLNYFINIHSDRCSLSVRDLERRDFRWIHWSFWPNSMVKRSFWLNKSYLARELPRHKHMERYWFNSYSRDSLERKWVLI